MTRSAMIGVAAVLAAVIAVFAWRSASERRNRDRWNDAIRSVVDTTRRAGWVETFASDRSMPLTEYDNRWRPLFGRILVDRRLAAAIGDPDGGWERDGGDDYAFRSGVPTGDVEITVDGWWDGHGSLGAQGAVQLEAPHRLYEAALWRGKLSLVYFIGPTPDKFEILAESGGAPLERGFYRITFCLERDGQGWTLIAALRDPAAGYQVLRQINARDVRLPEGVQGIGILGGGGRRGSYVTGIAVGDLGHNAGCGANATP